MRQESFVPVLLTNIVQRTQNYSKFSSAEVIRNEEYDNSIYSRIWLLISSFFVLRATGNFILPEEERYI